MIKRFLRWLFSLIFLLLCCLVLLGFAVYHNWASPWTIWITDPMVKWGVYQYGKPKLMEKIPLPASVIEVPLETSLEKSLQAYYKLTPEDRTLLLRETMVYGYYHWKQESPPPEEIKNLLLFVQQQSQDYYPLLNKNSTIPSPLN